MNWMTLLLISHLLFYEGYSIHPSSSLSEMIVIHERVGNSIDLEEKLMYGLFPEIIEFKNAVIYKGDHESYILEITILDDESGVTRIDRKSLSSKQLDKIRKTIDRKDIGDWTAFKKIGRRKKANVYLKDLSKQVGRITQIGEDLLVLKISNKVSINIHKNDIQFITLKKYYTGRGLLIGVLSGSISLTGFFLVMSKTDDSPHGYGALVAVFVGPIYGSLLGGLIGAIIGDSISHEYIFIAGDN